MNEIERLKSIDVNGAIKKALVEQEKSKSLDEIERAITTLIGYAGMMSGICRRPNERACSSQNVRAI